MPGRVRGAGVTRVACRSSSGLRGDDRSCCDPSAADGGDVDRFLGSAGDVGGEEVDAAAIEVPAGVVVVLGGAGVGVAGQDLGIA